MIPSGVPARLIDGVAVAGISGLWVAQTGQYGLSDSKGAYLLLVRLGQAIPIDPARMVPGRLMPGWSGRLSVVWLTLSYQFGNGSSRLTS